MTLLYNADSFAHHDDSLPEQAKQAYRIVVPHPATTLLFGERIKRSDPDDRLINASADGIPLVSEQDVADFGYPGISMETEESYFVHIKGTSVHQSGDSVTFQTNAKWTQYASQHMYLSAKKKLYMSSNRDMIISTDTAMGAEFVPNHGPSLDNVDFDERPADRLRHKLDKTMEIVTPAETETNPVLAALSAASDALIEALDNVRDQTIAQLNPDFALVLWQNKQAKPVEEMIAKSKNDLGFWWGLLAAAGNAAGTVRRHNAKRPDDGGSGLLDQIKKYTAAFGAVKKGFVGALGPEWVRAVSGPLDAFGGAWETAAGAYLDLVGLPEGASETGEKVKDQGEQDTSNEDEQYNYIRMGSQAAKHGINTLIKPLTQALDVIDALDDLVEDLQYAMQPWRKAPMQIMAAGQLTIDSMKSIDSFAADGYAFRSNRGSFAVRVRGQADLMGQSRAEVFSCGPTSIQGFQAVEVSSAGPVTIQSKKNSIELIGKKLYFGNVDPPTSLRSALEAAWSVTYDDEKQTLDRGSGTCPPSKKDEYNAYVALRAPAGETLKAPYAPSDLKEGPKAQGPAVPHVVRKTDQAEFDKTEYILAHSAREVTLAVGTGALIWNADTKGTPETSDNAAYLCLRTANAENKADIAMGARNKVDIKCGDWHVLVTDDCGITIAKGEGDPKILIEDGQIVIRKGDDKKIVVDSNGVKITGGDSTAEFKSGSATIDASEIHLGT